MINEKSKVIEKCIKAIKLGLGEVNFVRSLRGLPHGLPQRITFIPEDNKSPIGKVSAIIEKEVIISFPAMVLLNYLTNGQAKKYLLEHL